MEGGKYKKKSQKGKETFQKGKKKKKYKKKGKERSRSRRKEIIASKKKKKKKKNINNNNKNKNNSNNNNHNNNNNNNNKKQQQQKFRRSTQKRKKNFDGLIFYLFLGFIWSDQSALTYENWIYPERPEDINNGIDCIGVSKDFCTLNDTLLITCRI